MATKVLRSLIQEKIPFELRVELELLSRRRDIVNREKQDELIKLLRNYDIEDIVPLGPGTNRYAFKLDGFVVKFPIADGNGRTPAEIRYKGKTVIKADNGMKYRCLQLSYLELDDGKYKNIVDFYVSDDENHVPIRLDMFLKFGSAKAFLVGMKGIANPMESQLK